MAKYGPGYYTSVEGDSTDVMQILSSRVEFRCSNPLHHHLDAPRHRPNAPQLAFCAAQSHVVNVNKPQCSLLAQRHQKHTRYYPSH